MLDLDVFNKINSMKYTLIVSCAVLILYSCNDHNNKETQEVKTPADTLSTTLANLPDESIFNLNSKWVIFSIKSYKTVS